MENVLDKNIVIESFIDTFLHFENVPYAKHKIFKYIFIYFYL